MDLFWLTERKDRYKGTPVAALYDAAIRYYQAVDRLVEKEGGYEHGVEDENMGAEAVQISYRRLC